MNHRIREFWRNYLAAPFVALSVVGTGFLAASPMTAADTSASKGRIPREAFRSDGTITRGLVPDFVVAYARDGSVAGYVSRDAILPLEPQRLLRSDGGKLPSIAAIPVLDDTLSRLVGHMVPGRGFVRIGARAEDTPPFEGHLSTARPNEL